MPAPTITPSLTVYRSGATPKPTYSATGSGGSIAWSSPDGTFSPITTANGVSTTFTPDNKTQSAVITAKDTSDNATRTAVLAVTATCPDRGQFGSAPIELDDRTNVSQAEDGGQSFLVKGPPFRIFPYQFPNRTQAQFDAMEAFWLFHRKTIKFYLEDPIHDNLFRLVRFDSKLQIDVQGADMIGWSCTFREAVPT